MDKQRFPSASCAYQDGVWLKKSQKCALVMATKIPKLKAAYAMLSLGFSKVIISSSLELLWIRSCRTWPRSSTMSSPRYSAVVRWRLEAPGKWKNERPRGTQKPASCDRTCGSRRFLRIPSNSSTFSAALEMSKRIKVVWDSLTCSCFILLDLPESKQPWFTSLSNPITGFKGSPIKDQR